MPPKIKTTRSQIIAVATDLVREKGWESINARDIAKRLNCSTQPIFRAFVNMHELKDEIRHFAWDSYNNYLASYELNSDMKGLSFGVAYVKFAKVEKNLFKLIFMADEIKEKNITELAMVQNDKMGIIDIFMGITGLDRDNAIKLHLSVWMSMHGLASMVATNTLEITDDEIQEVILNSFKGSWDILKRKGE